MEKMAGISGLSGADLGERWPGQEGHGADSEMEDRGEKELIGLAYTFLGSRGNLSLFPRSGEN